MATCASMAPAAPPDLLATVRRKLEAALKPESLVITDDSARHAGHREAAGRFHLNIAIVSARFRGLSGVERHRLVYAALAEELAGPVHALNLDARLPVD
ncbi:MAG: BolA family protein [Terriglobales bacterium]